MFFPGRNIDRNPNSYTNCYAHWPLAGRLNQMNGCGFRRLALACLLLCALAARAEIYTVPLLVSSVASGGPQGMVRIVNGTDGSGTVTVHAIDDAGVRHGPATFALSASAAAEFTAGDLAAGNAAKGLSGGIGRRSGDVRLEIETDLDIVPLAFVRAPDGTLSAMHDTVRAASGSESGQYRYEVPAFNPASDAVQASRLRLINPGDAAAAVTVAGRDDSGAAATGGDVRLTLPAGGARTLTAQQLEAGATGLSGQLGAGTGRWRLTVAADAPLEVVNVVTAPAGYWSNLSTTAAPGEAPADRAAFDARFLDRAIIARAGGERSAFRVQSGGRFTETNESDGVTETYFGDYGYGRIGPDAGRLEARYDDGEVCAANLYFSTRMAGWFASRCVDVGDPEAYWSGGSWSVGDPGEPGGGGTSYGAGDTVATLPAGSWTPDVTSGGSFSLSGGDVTVRLDSGGYIEEGEYRYTCQSAGGCEVVNRRVRSGTIAQTAAGTPPGTRPPPADTSPSFADGSGPGDQSYTAGAAIAPLTLPAASGGDGTLTYTLTPTVPGLSFDAATRRLTGTPSAAGAHDMAYTATDADGDTATLRFGIAVRAAGGGPAGFDLDADNGRAEGIAWAGGRVHVVDSGADKAFAYGAGGQREAASDFDLDADNGSPTGIAWSGSSFHVVDGADDKVYAYGAGGGREAASDFDLHGDNGRAEGVVHAGGRLYVVDRGADRVFAYGAGGQREAAAEFDLHADNGSPSGIAWSDGRFYVADASDDKVYAYTAGGQRDAASEFDLDDDNGNPAGIAWSDGAFLVVDASDDKVYAYAGASGPGGGETSYGTGDTVATLPTGFWTPDVTSGGSFGATGGDVTVRLDNGGYIEEGGHRYTCQSAGGCEIVNRRVESGTITQTAAGAPPGTSPPPADTSPVFAAGSGPGDQTYTVGAAIDALTLPAASGGDGTLTYSLSPSVPGLGFDAATRRLTGAPSAAGDHTVTYTVTDADGDTDSLTFTISVQTAGGGQTPTYGVGDTLSDLPTGSWVPDLTSGATFSSSGGNVTIRITNGGYIEEGEYRYTCQSGGGCMIENRRVSSGAIARTAKGTVPGDGSNGSGGGSAAGDFDLHGDNGAPTGMAYANDRFHVLDWFDGKVYAYSTDGQRDPAADFDLQDGHDSPNYRIAYANGRFYVHDRFDGKLYAYRIDGRRDPAVDFDLHDDNGWPFAMVYANGRFHVLDGFDDKVYVYTAGGRRDAAADFDLHDDNGSPGAIAYANDRFHVLDGSDDKVYAYTVDGRRDAAADFDLHDDNGSPGAIAYANGRFHVLDGSDDKVYAYTVDGQTVGGGDASPNFASGSGPGNQSYIVGTAIGALTLPAASGGNGALTYSLSPAVPGLSFNATTRRLTGTPSSAGTYSMTYRVRDADGDTDTLSFTVVVESGGGQATTFGVGDTLPGVPTGSFFPRVTSGGSIVISGGSTTITLRNGGYFELNDGTRYTCTSSGGCSIENGTVTQGALVGGPQGGSGSFAPADEQAFNNLVVGNRMHGEDFYTDFPSTGRFLESGSFPGSFSYASTGSDSGTLILTYDDSGQFGGSCTLLLTFVSATTGTLSYTCASGLQGQGSWTITAGDVPPAPAVAPRDGTDTALDIGFRDSFGPGETRAYDFQIRKKAPGESWLTVCRPFTNNSSNAVTATVIQGFASLESATVYEIRYRFRNSSSCDAGTPARWSLIGEAKTTGTAQGLGFSETGSVTRSIPENLPGGINVGVPVSAVRGDALTYSIGGADAQSFDIVAETGQIRTSDDVWYDYETKNRYEVEVTVADDVGNRESIDVTIDLADLAPN